MVQPESALLVLFYDQAQRIYLQTPATGAIPIHQGLAGTPVEITEEKIIMKAIVVTDQAAGTAGMKLVERPEPKAAINDVIVKVHTSGFVPTRP
jgi:hypothetical protein